MKPAHASHFRNPYENPGPWWKVGLHIHTTNSDGGLKTEAAIDSYAALGFDALCITDHDFITLFDHRKGAPLLIPCAEISTKGAHILALGMKGEGAILPKNLTPQKGINRAIKMDGIPVVAHPGWSSNDLLDLLSWKGYAGIEIFNSSAHDAHNRGIALELWDQLLGRGKKVWGFAGDDAHFKWDIGYPGSGYLWVKAPQLTVTALTTAIRKGAFHATRGPRIFKLEVKGPRLTLLTSPAQKVFVVSHGSGAGFYAKAAKPDGDTIWHFDVIEKSSKLNRYMRFEVYDSEGLGAWSNPLYILGKGINGR